MMAKCRRPRGSEAAAMPMTITLSPLSATLMSVIERKRTTKSGSNVMGLIRLVQRKRSR
jgi:hypothetical protein